MAEGEWGGWLHPQGKAAPSNGSCCTHLHVAGLGGVGLKVKNLPHFALNPPQICCVGGVLGGGCLGSPLFPILQQEETIPAPQSAAQRRSKPSSHPPSGQKPERIETPNNPKPTQTTPSFAQLPEHPLILMAYSCFLPRQAALSAGEEEEEGKDQVSL